MFFLSGLKIFKFRSAWAKIAAVVIDKTKGKIDLVAYGFYGYPWACSQKISISKAKISVWVGVFKGRVGAYLVGVGSQSSISTLREQGGL